MLKRFIVVFVLFLNGKALGNEIESQWAFDWLFGLQAHDVRDSVVNPGNKLLQIDAAQIFSEFRGNYKLKANPWGQLILRPRWLVQTHWVKDFTSDTMVEKGDGHLDLTECFVENGWSDSISSSIGLQNYQWGPAEMLSPSNPVFHFSSNQRSYLFQEKGKVIARVNWSHGSALSVVFLQNFLDNLEKFWIADRTFEKISLVKFETRSQQNANRYLGMVLGEQEAQKKFFGLYANYNFLDTYSFYIDSKVVDGSIAYYPKEISIQNYVLTSNSSEQENTQVNFITGFRWESDWDWRFEYYYNSSGYTQEDIQNGLKGASLTNAFSLANLNRLTRSGLDLLGQHYFYSSVRIPDWGIKKDGTFYVRYFISLQDTSSVIQFSFDQPFNDNWIYNLEAVAQMGTDQNELSLTERFSGFAGLKRSW